MASRPLDTAGSHSIGAILQQEITALGQMLELLRAEHHALRKRDNEALSAAVEQKQQQVMQLARLGQERERLLQLAGCDKDATGLRNYIAAHADAKALERAQTQFRELATGCQKQNQINAVLAENQRYHVERALSLLQGGDSTPEGYGRRGQTLHSKHQSTTLKA